MANNDILYKDASATPQSFYPEATDLGSSVRRSMFGSSDGAQVTLGAKADAPAASPSVASTLMAVMRGIWTTLLSPIQDIRSTGNTLNSATLGAVYNLAVNGEGVAAFTITGLMASGATLVFEASNNGGGRYDPANAPTSAGPVSTITADGSYRLNAAGHTNVQLRVSVVGTGNITVSSSVSAQVGVVSVNNAVMLAPNQSVSDAQSASYGGILNTLTPGASGAFGTAVAAGRGFRVICTAAGNISVTYADGSTDTYPVAVGRSVFPEQIISVAIPTSGGATATFANLK